MKTLYCGIILTQKSRTKLLKKFPPIQGWAVYAHHMTIAFGKALANVEGHHIATAGLKLTVTHIGNTDGVIAVKVKGYFSENKTPHITLYVDRAGGFKPADSNYITHWIPVQEFTLIGTSQSVEA